MQCHLTLDEGELELADGFCPECFDGSGVELYDFERVTNPETDAPRYRCDDCGIFVGEDA